MAILEAILLGGAADALANSGVKVPMANYGVRSLLGKRYGEVLDEGPALKLPYVEDIELFPYEHRSRDVTAEVNSSDRQGLKITVRIQYRPARILVRKTFAQVSETLITDGLSGFIKSEVGIVAATKPGVTFISKREALQYLIKSVLVLSEVPHLVPHKYNAAKYPQGKKVLPKNRLSFYSDMEVQENLRKHFQEEMVSTNLSPVERLHAIEILDVVLENIEFNKKTQDAFDEEIQAKAKNAAIEQRMQKTTEIMKKVIDVFELEPEKAADFALVQVGLAEKKVQTFEGLKGAFNFALGKGKGGA